jgi:DNA repair photolyase
VTNLELFPPEPPPPGPLDRLLRVSRIYLEPGVEDFTRGRDILARFPGAERVQVRSHWNIPGLFGNEGNAEAWNHIKGSTLVLGVKKSMGFEVNGRSADFLPPSMANGCVMSCAYCYVPRHKGYANPVTVFVNIEQIAAAIRRHAGKLGPKTEPNTVDPRYWVYDIGCNSDCSADAALSDNVKDLVRLFTVLPKAKLLDVRTSPISERIAAIDDFVAAGYEVHLNFSPVVVTEGWQAEYDALFQQLDDTLGDKAKEQLAAEIIFLTHNERLHEVNLRWHPKAEELLWRPELQEAKVSQGGGVNVRYRTGYKGRLVEEFKELLARRMPYCRVRYAF